MSNQITHLYYAEKLYNKFFKDKDEKDFFVGALFPDIRYVAGADKDITHFYKDNNFVRDLIYINKDDSAFMCGIKIHNLVDCINTKHLRNCVYDIYYKKYEHIRTSVLLLEDIISSKNILNLSEYCNFFDNILYDECRFSDKIKSNDIEKWHRLLKEYLFKPADEMTFYNFSSSIGCFDDNIIKADIDIYKAIKNDKIIIGVIENIRNEIDNLTYNDIFKI